MVKEISVLAVPPVTTNTAAHEVPHHEGILACQFMVTLTQVNASLQVKLSVTLFPDLA